MKIKRTVIIMGLLIIFSACKKNKIENHLIGTWKCEYEILEDGSKNYDTPFALMDFQYSDGFVLNKDGTGSTIWLDAPNDEIEWSNSKNKLVIYNKYWSGELIDYNYSIKNVSNDRLIFENYKGHKYQMTKE